MIYIRPFSVVIPALNEEATLESVIVEVHGVVQQMGVDYEIILVNDGSTDRTGEIGRTLTRCFPNIRLIENYPSRHYGGALKVGFLAAEKELIVLFPSDKQFIFSEIYLLLAELSDADLVSGYRTNRQDNIVRRFIGVGWNIVVRVLFGYLCRDINCGFKIFRRVILDHVKLSGDGASIDTELLVGAKARGYRIKDVKLTHLPRIAGKATGVDLKVILRAFRDLYLFKIRLNREIRKENSYSKIPLR